MIDAGIVPAPWGRPPSVAIGPYSHEAMGPLASMLASGGPGSAVWPSANLALFYPFSVSKPITAVKLWVVNGSAVSGNLDLGIYDASGARLVSKGSTAQAGTTAMQIVDTTDLGLAPNVQYYMALAFDNGTAQTRCWTLAGTGRYAAMGMAQMAAAFPLPATATFALMAQAYLPIFGLSQLVTF